MYGSHCRLLCETGRKCGLAGKGILFSMICLRFRPFPVPVKSTGEREERQHICYRRRSVDIAKPDCFFIENSRAMNSEFLLLLLHSNQSSCIINVLELSETNDWGLVPWRKKRLLLPMEEDVGKTPPYIVAAPGKGVGTNGLKCRQRRGILTQVALQTIRR